MNTRPSPHVRLVRWLLLASLLMFAFGFLLVPLYDVFCRVTGLNGKVLRTGPLEQTMAIDPSRTVKVQFVAIHNENMPWKFEPESPVVEVMPGESRQTAFIASNPTSRLMTAQAVPSIAPSEAAAYVQKINCFCFEQQQLASQAQVRMPLVFVVDGALPAHIGKITISYTLFDITQQQHTSTRQAPESREISL